MLFKAHFIIFYGSFSKYQTKLLRIEKKSPFKSRKEINFRFIKKLNVTFG